MPPSPWGEGRATSHHMDSSLRGRQMQKIIRWAVRFLLLYFFLFSFSAFPVLSLKPFVSFLPFSQVHLCQRGRIRIGGCQGSKPVRPFRGLVLLCHQSFSFLSPHFFPFQLSYLQPLKYNRITTRLASPHLPVMSFHFSWVQLAPPLPCHSRQSAWGEAIWLYWKRRW